MLYVWSLTIVVIATINNVYSQARDTVLVTDWKKCATTDDKVRSFYSSITLETCVKRCMRRAHCVAVNYWRRTGSCDLLGSVTGFVSNDVSKNPCVHVSGPAVEDARCNCDSGKICSQDWRKCFIKECPLQHVQNGVVHGNIQTKGSKATVVCQDGFHLVAPPAPMVCGNKGSWTNVPRCSTCTVEPPCSRFTHTKEPAQGDGLLPGATREYFCKPGYSTTNGEGAFTITCQSDLTWSEPTTYCKASGESDVFSIVGCQVLYFSNHKWNSGDARSTCSNLGGDLIRIDTEDKQTAVTEYIQVNGIDRQDFWIQGQLNVNRMKWYFSDGSEITEPFWAPGKPDDGRTGGETCIRMQRSQGYRWNDRECSREYHYICELFDD